MTKNILFQLSSSIAAYKACTVISKLIQDGFQVQPVCSPSTFHFIGTSTLEGLTGKKVFSDVFEEGRAMDHIQLSKWAHATILCPATANQLNKLAAGIADDVIGNLFLTQDFKKPYLIFPAMNEKMWQHPTVKNSVRQLREWGVRVLDPESGRQACGDVGPGRMQEPEEILFNIRSLFSDGGLK